jgi:hypothetical protein
MSTSNNAVMEMKKKTEVIGKDITNWRFSTLASFFVSPTNHIQDNIGMANYNECLEMLNDCDKIVIDEVFMTSPEHMRILVNSRVPIIFVGDQYQLPPITGTYDENYDMCNFLSSRSIVTVKEFNKKGRYDKRSFDMFEEFKTTGKLSALRDIAVMTDEVLPFYICCTNQMRRKYTKKCCKTFYPDGKKETFHYQGDEETYRVGDGMPVIYTGRKASMKELSINNNWTGHASFTSDGIKVKGLMMKDGEWTKDGVVTVTEVEFSKSFLPFHAGTVHKVQGAKIDSEYGIVEMGMSMCNRNSLYTAITRCSNFENIRMNRADKQFYPLTEYESDPIFMNKDEDNYKVFHLVSECDCDAIKSYFVVGTGKKGSLPPSSMMAFKKKHNGCVLQSVQMTGKRCTYETIMNIKSNIKQANTKIKPIVLKVHSNVMTEVKKRASIKTTADRLTLVYYEGGDMKRVEVKHKRCGLEKAREKIKKAAEDRNICDDLDFGL